VETTLLESSHRQTFQQLVVWPPLISMIEPACF
jgi:hypothetical protein